MPEAERLAELTRNLAASPAGSVDALRQPVEPASDECSRGKALAGAGAAGVQPLLGSKTVPRSKAIVREVRAFHAADDRQPPG
jgi:hypothetical protein